MIITPRVAFAVLAGLLGGVATAIYLHDNLWVRLFEWTLALVFFGILDRSIRLSRRHSQNSEREKAE